MIDTQKAVMMATIDIGAHSVRMLIAQVRPDKTFEVIEFLEQRIPLGSSVFKNGRISNNDINLLCEIFKNFRRKIDEYGIKLYKAIATSAVREASNSDIFIERIKHTSGLNVSIFEGIDGARLDYLSVTRDIPPKYEFAKKRMMIADIGTGACQISLYDKGNISLTETIRVGTLRILEVMPSTISAAGMALALAPFVTKSFSELEHISSSLKVDGLVAMGSSVRALTFFASDVRIKERSVRITRKKFYEIYKSITEKKIEKIVEDHKISPDLAEAVVPCCLILDYLFKLTDAADLIVPVTSTKDALLMDFIHETLSEEDYFAPQIIAMGRSIAAKYNCDNEYTRRTVKFSEALFKHFKFLHGLGEKEMLLLKLAAYLHKTGLFINNQAYHKHSYYLINSSDIPGISKEERFIVALIARYHRKSMPKTAHMEYVSLAPEKRMVLNKLASMLRLACGLAEVCTDVNDFSVREKDNNTVEIKLNVTDILYDKSFLDNDAGFFYYVYARKILFI